MQGKANEETPDIHFAASNHSSKSGRVDIPRPCTADELLPMSADGVKGSAVEWAINDMVEPRYGCDCPFYKAG